MDGWSSRSFLIVLGWFGFGVAFLVSRAVHLWDFGGCHVEARGWGLGPGWPQGWILGAVRRGVGGERSLMILPSSFQWKLLTRPAHN